MSDIIYYKNGEETYRISPPTLEEVLNLIPEDKRILGVK
jgi:hypothetical protein